MFYITKKGITIGPKKCIVKDANYLLLGSGQRSEQPTSGARIGKLPYLVQDLYLSVSAKDIFKFNLRIHLSSTNV